MTNKTSGQLKTFLSLKKTSIYLGIALFGLIIKLLDQPGNTFILSGLGLFLGHVSYGSVKFPGKMATKIVTMLLVTLCICAIILIRYNIPRATLLLLIASGLSLIIEWLTKYPPLMDKPSSLSEDDHLDS